MKEVREDIVEREDEIDKLFADLIEEDLKGKDMSEQHPKWQALYHFDEI